MSQASRPAVDQYAMDVEQWPEVEHLDHRSQSLPLNMRSIPHLNLDPAQFALQKGPPAQPNQQSSDSQSIRHSATPAKPVSSDAQRSTGSTLSAWRQSLQDTGSLSSADSRLSETISSKKRQTVLVWDLDETLILFHSLLSGAWTSSHSPQVCLTQPYPCIEGCSTFLICG